MRNAILLLGLFLLAAAPGAQAAGCSGTPEECEVDARLSMAGIDRPEEARAFLARLKQAAAADDREALVGMVRYPLTVYGPGKPRLYGNAEALLADFDKVFTPGVKNAIGEAAYGSLFIRDQGAMIGNGEVWFDGAGGRILIKTINPPDPPDASRAPTNGEAAGIRTHLDLNAALRRFGDVRLYLEDRPLQDFALKGSAAASDRLRSAGGCAEVY